MIEGERHAIDDTEQVRPPVRLCHLILSDSLARGVTSIKVAAGPGTIPTAWAQTGDAWQEYMAFPPAVYVTLLEHFKLMAGLAPEERQAQGTILVRWQGRNASVALSVRPDANGVDEIALLFPRDRSGVGVDPASSIGST